jgi:hypothetical protein
MIPQLGQAMREFETGKRVFMDTNPFDQFDSATSGPVYGPPPMPQRSPLVRRPAMSPTRRNQARSGSIQGRPRRS